MTDKKIIIQFTMLTFLLFHTMFNAASPIFGTMTMTWAGTIAANAVIVVVSILTVVIYDKKSRIA